MNLKSRIEKLERRAAYGEQPLSFDDQVILERAHIESGKPWDEFVADLLEKDRAGQ